MFVKKWAFSIGAPEYVCETTKEGYTFQVRWMRTMKPC